jgi:hypothetical protein
LTGDIDFLVLSSSETGRRCSGASGGDSTFQALSTGTFNMAFLRDRMIEAGKCGGLDLGWNLKRGGPDLSLDFLAERLNGEVLGIDIAFDYDNLS